MTKAKGDFNMSKASELLNNCGCSFDEVLTMTKPELRQSVTTYCDNIKKTMLRNVKVFPGDWDMRHVRAIMSMGFDPKTDSLVKPIIKQIKKTQTLHQLTFPG